MSQYFVASTRIYQRGFVVPGLHTWRHAASKAALIPYYLRYHVGYRPSDDAEVHLLTFLLPGDILEHRRAAVQAALCEADLSDIFFKECDTIKSFCFNNSSHGVPLPVMHYCAN